ncbi:hypothetical protein GCM10007938_20280 [Vibrio zhanjiangensis]|uniref:Uncharacterized protein n=1 Tax=Vibrio zhanjiangensis TaxID=1046128 RepID=A0ABQ6EYG6_9VIBR|nr:hypothetical protein GCM10007938_20280 [Vibrio zhanjiangensis]
MSPTIIQHIENDLSCYTLSSLRTSISHDFKENARAGDDQSFVEYYWSPYHFIYGYLEWHFYSYYYIGANDR